MHMSKKQEMFWGKLHLLPVTTYVVCAGLKINPDNALLSTGIFFFLF